MTAEPVPAGAVVTSDTSAAPDTGEQAAETPETRPADTAVRARALRRSIRNVVLVDAVTCGLILVTDWGRYSPAVRVVAVLAALLAVSVLAWSGRVVRNLVGPDPVPKDRDRRASWTLFAILVGTQLPLVLAAGAGAVLGG